MNIADLRRIVFDLPDTAEVLFKGPNFSRASDESPAKEVFESQDQRLLVSYPLSLQMVTMWSIQYWEQTNGIEQISLPLTKNYSQGDHLTNSDYPLIYGVNVFDSEEGARCQLEKDMAAALLLLEEKILQNKKHQVSLKSLGRPFQTGVFRGYVCTKDEKGYIVEVVELSSEHYRTSENYCAPITGGQYCWNRTLFSVPDKAISRGRVLQSIVLKILVRDQKQLLCTIAKEKKRRKAL